MGKAIAPNFDQDSFRGRTNVINPTGVNAAFDGGDAAPNADWTQDITNLFRVRFLIQQTVATADNHADLITEFALQYQVNGGDWNNVAAQGETTDAVRYADADFADGDNTTQLLGSGTFVTGDGVEVTPSDSVTFTNLALTETELEFALEIYTGEVYNGDTVKLRVIYSAIDESPPATVLQAYTNTPTITVSGGSDKSLIDDLVSYYKLDENAASTDVEDIHGANEGTASQNTSNFYSASGKINSAFLFDASGEQVDLNGVIVPASADFTINIWAKSTNTSQPTTLLSQYAGGQAGRMGLMFYHTVFGASYFLMAPIELTGTDLTDGGYHMLTVTRNGNDYVLYEDGSSVDTGNSSQAIYTGRNTWFGELAASVEGLLGTMDEVAIFNADIGQAGVTKLWNSGNGLVYPFEEGPTTYTKEFTTDAYIQDTFTKEFTTDAFLQVKDNDKEFTTDAILKATTDKEFTADAILKKSDNDKEFTVDAFLQQQDKDIGFTVDARITLIGEKEFTSDAILKKSDNDKEFTADSILKKSDIDKELTVDALLQKADNDKTLTVDALLQAQDQDKTLTADAFIQQQDNDKTFTSDAIIQKPDNDKEFTVDSILKKSDNDKEFTTDAFIQKADNDKELTVDSILKKSDIDKTFTVDAVLESEGVVTYDKTFTVDAIIGPAFVRGGPARRRRRIKEYEMDIFAEVIREKYEERKIYSPLEIRREKEIPISSNISKETESDLNLLVKIDHRKLFGVLDAI